MLSARRRGRSTSPRRKSIFKDLRKVEIVTHGSLNTINTYIRRWWTQLKTINPNASQSWRWKWSSLRGIPKLRNDKQATDVATTVRRSQILAAICRKNFAAIAADCRFEDGDGISLHQSFMYFDHFAPQYIFIPYQTNIYGNLGRGQWTSAWYVKPCPNLLVFTYSGIIGCPLSSNFRLLQNSHYE